MVQEYEKRMVDLSFRAVVKLLVNNKSLCDDLDQPFTVVIPELPQDQQQRGCVPLPWIMEYIRVAMDLLDRMFQDTEALYLYACAMPHDIIEEQHQLHGSKYQDYVHTHIQLIDYTLPYMSVQTINGNGHTACINIPADDIVPTYVTYVRCLAYAGMTMQGRRLWSKH